MPLFWNFLRYLYLIPRKVFTFVDSNRCLEEKSGRDLDFKKKKRILFQLWIQNRLYAPKKQTVQAAPYTTQACTLGNKCMRRVAIKLIGTHKKLYCWISDDTQELLKLVQLFTENMQTFWITETCLSEGCAFSTIRQNHHEVLAGAAHGCLYRLRRWCSSNPQVHTVV